MKTGDIIFVEGTSFLSRIIKFFDKGRFSHVAIAISENEIIEAQYFTKVRKVDFYFDKYEIVDLDFTKEEQEKIIKYCNDMLGKWYDYPQIIWYVIRRIFRLEKGNPLNSPNNFICSELIFYILLRLGRTKGKRINADVTPNELYNYLKTLQR